ncbi:MAG: response regulator [Spirochaetales bacterium]|nr:response regulator [Spirochaetales bacterium]
MIKKRIVFIALGVLLILIFGYGLWTVADGLQVVQLSGGRSSESLQAGSGKIHLLRGEWLASWSDKTPSQAPSESGEFTEPSAGFRGIWNTHRAGIFSPDAGFVSYYANVKTEGYSGIQAVRIPPFYSTCRFYVNGEEIFSRGTAGSSYAEEVSFVSPGIAYFVQDTDELEFIIQVTNFHTFRGGSPFFGVEYGSPEAINRIARLIKDLFLTLVFVILGFTFYCGVRALFTNTGRYHFFLALGFAVLLGRMFLGDVLFFQTADVIKNLPFQIGERLKFILLYLSIPLFVNFGYAYLERVEGGRKAVIVSQILSLIAVFTAVFLPGRFLGFLVPTEYLSLMIGTGFIIYLSIQGMRKPVSLALLFLISAGILFLFSTYSLLYTLGVFQSQVVFWGGVFLSFIAVGVMLFLRERKFLSQTAGLKNRLDEVISSRDSILLSLSDEVGETLNKVNTLAMTLLQGSLGPLNSEQLVTTSLVLSNTMMHQNLLNDTIDFVRLSEHTLKIKKDSVNLFSAAYLAIGSFKPVILGLNVDIDNEIPRGLPPLWADEQKLGQIFHTLISFGIENAQDGHIHITAAAGDEVVNVSVSITGLNRQVDVDKVLDVSNLEGQLNFRGKEDFIGLRFYLVHEILKLHDSGLSEVKSEDGVIFNFTLPTYLQKEAVDEAIAEELAIHFDAIQNLQPLLEEVESERDILILAASGDPGNLQIIKSQLASMNYQIQPVISGEELFRCIREKLPDMVVIDSSLKDMTNFEVCRTLRNEFTSDELPVILMIEDSADVMETLTSGASDYLRKPYQQEEFLTRVNTHLQLSKINSIYSQFVPREFLKALGQENIIDLKLGDQVQREMTILFVDIRAFTNLSENMTPQENFKFINSYLSQFSPIITRNNGFVDKFIGDAIMALYPDKPEDAIKTAIEMVEYVRIYNSYRANCGYEPINIGVGIHTGNMILGIVGDNQRMQGTVISDAVNLASRIQDVTKLYKSNVVISQETFIKLDNPTEFNFRFLGKVKVKGKDKSVSLFEIFNSDDEELRKLKEETKGEFETAILLFAKRDFIEAKKLFEKVLSIHPGDKTAMLFLDRADKFLVSEKKSFLTSL